MKLTERLLVLGMALIQTAALGADWNPKLTAEYLDNRQQEWFAWAPTKSIGGPCVSCHTGVTYLMARPLLRRALGEAQPTAYETGLLNGLRARAAKREPKDISAYLKEPASTQAIGVESILAALFLAREDEPRGVLGPQTLKAFDRLWDLQQKDGKLKGAWAWYDFSLDPYETADSAFYGATLAAMAIGSTPKSYRDQEEVKVRISALNGYLSSAYPQQPLHNQLMLAWASTKLRGTLSNAVIRSLVEETLKKQQGDGGWTMASLGPWKENTVVKPPSGSDSYAILVHKCALPNVIYRHQLDPSIATNLW